MGAKMKKRIGIVGGISAASTAQYYRTITDLYYERFNDYYYPEILIYSLDFQYFTDLENSCRQDEYIKYITGAVLALEKAGAELAAMAANSPHSVFDEVSREAGIPMVSIVDATVKEAKRQNIKNALLTGIKYTMSSSFYQKGFHKMGLGLTVPTEAHKKEIDDIIFKELVIHKINDTSRNRFLDIANSYNVDGIILGCTEIPQLIKQENTKLKTLDTLMLHCKSILEEAAGSGG